MNMSVNSTSHSFLNLIVLKPVTEVTDELIDLIIESNNSPGNYEVSRNYIKEYTIKWLTKSPELHFMATINNQLIGFIGAIIDEGECYINDIVVKNDYRKSGIGSYLLSSIEKIVKPNYDVVLDIYKPELKTFYENQGYLLQSENVSQGEDEIPIGIKYWRFKKWTV